tara:strand:- start:7848 stop:9164 length:1317 start_codon:yes stop_codon:yes gene_type:complete
MAAPTLTPQSVTSSIILPVTGTHASGNFPPSSSLPYGMYANTGSALYSVGWISGAVDQVSFTYKMLGGDVLDIEITENNVYSSYEIATLEYCYIINSHQAKNVLSDFLGSPTGTFDQDGILKSGELSSSLLGTQASLKYPKFTFEASKRVANGLSTEAAMGDARIYSASITLVNDKQDYDLQEIVQDASTDGSEMGQDFANKVDNKRIEIKRVYYRSPRAMWRFYAYYGGLNVVGNLQSYGQYSDDSTFELVPTWQNKLQAMAYETNLYTRASHYSYEIRDNRIRVYPPPAEPGTGSPTKIWFEFAVRTDSYSTGSSDRKDGVNGVNNYNTLPFANIPYQNINSMGKQWIRKYALAVSKEMLAQVRGKFGSIPIPGNDITLNASELMSQAKDEQAALKEDLKTLLDELTYSALAGKDADTVDASNRIQVGVPLNIIVG